MSEFDPLAPVSGKGNFEEFEQVDENLVSSTQYEEDIYSPSNDNESPDLISTTPDPEPEAATTEPEKEFINLSEQPVEEKQSTCCLKTAKDMICQNVDPRVMDLVLWKDPKKTGAVLVSIMALLVSLQCFSVISVVANLSLSLLVVAMCVVLYKRIMAAMNKGDDGHPFKAILDKECTMTADQLHALADKMFHVSNDLASSLVRLFLVQDMIDSLKFGIALWLLTYVGSWFNGMTCLMIDTILLFTVPKIYVTYQVQIDEATKKFVTRVEEVTTQIRSKIPIGGKKKEE